MMKLYRVGFFKELRHGDPQGPSLADSKGLLLDFDERLVDYLKGAPVFVASPGPVGDVLDESTGPVASSSLHTDGVYVWPADLAYYVERYRVGLPDEFLQHVRDEGFIPSANVNLFDLEL